MLDTKTLNAFIGKANQSYQQLCIWLPANNEFVKHQARWNDFELKNTLFSTEEFTKKHGCRYKNFWMVVMGSLQHGWVLGTARLFDPAYNSRDKKKENPRLSLDFILEQLGDEGFKNTIKTEQASHELVIKSLKGHRDNSHAHNDLNYSNNRIEAGVEKLYEWLETVIVRIKDLQPHLKNCNTINLKYNEKLAQFGVEEIFDDLVKAEKSELKTEA
ncbi:MAG TPA: hypothetical protein VGO21_00970 [Candidatus Paceibacterota bacterium]|jgi:hypothetical protein|nr:hypothetical protein [Candidatus Paceibacterota bacterium]